MLKFSDSFSESSFNSDQFKRPNAKLFILSENKNVRKNVTFKSDIKKLGKI